MYKNTVIHLKHERNNVNNYILISKHRLLMAFIMLCIQFS